jgi:DNA ligase-1
MQKLSKLYKYSTTGKAQSWEIIVTDNTFYTIEGQVGGKLTTSLPTVCKGKNIGKANETSDKQQAYLEAKAKWQKKIDKGYNEVLSTEKKFFEPMLAHVLEDYKNLLFTVPTFIQPKMDGLACISQNNTLMSRNGKPYLSCPHLYQNEVILHGELYNSEYSNDFNKIVSLCKKTKPTLEDIKEAEEKVQLWIYDYPTSKEKVFSERYKDLKEWYKKVDNKKYVLVPTFNVKNLKEIEKYNEKFLSEGYEGSIVRLDLGPYENKRSKQVLKLKQWMDEEFEILDAIEGEGGRTGTIGKFIVKLNNGNTCKTNIKGNFDYLKDIWKNHKNYIGKKATIKFFGYTPDGSLRFPYVIKIDRDSYE